MGLPREHPALVVEELPATGGPSHGGSEERDAIAEELASQEPFASVGRRITQADFPAIIEFIRAQVRSRFGPEADRPD